MLKPGRLSISLARRGQGPLSWPSSCPWFRHQLVLPEKVPFLSSRNRWASPAASARILEEPESGQARSVGDNVRDGVPRDKSRFLGSRFWSRESRCSRYSMVSVLPGRSQGHSEVTCALQKEPRPHPPFPRQLHLCVPTDSPRVQLPCSFPVQRQRSSCHR